jgi:hypothetical protein
MLYAATTNILSVDSATFTGGVGTATAVDGASVSQNTSISIDGNASLYVECSAAVNGVRGGVYLQATAAATGRHIASVYLRGSGQVRVYIRDETVGSDGVETVVTLDSNKWVRVQAGRTTTVGNTLRIYVIEETADSGAAFYVDKAQIEATGGNGASPWVAGGTTHALNGRLNLCSASKNPFSGYSDTWSINFWVSGYLFDTVTPYLLYWDASNYLQLNGVDLKWLIGGKSHDSGSFFSAGNGAWRMVSLVLYRAADGTATTELWVDGVLAESNAHGINASLLDLSIVTQFDVGSDGTSAGIARAMFDSLLVVPYRLTSTWIGRLWNSGAGAYAGAWPKHRVTGDIIGGRSAVDCVAEVTGADAMPYATGGAMVNGAVSVSFTLHEV